MNNQPDPIAVNGWRIDNTLLEQKSITRCEIAQCKGGCCADGVWVDMGQARDILSHAELIMPFMPEERRDTASWFAEHYDDDPAFPSGEYIGTTTVVDTTHPGGTTCVFLRPEDRYCAIQAASIANGMHAWELKPHYCCLYPLVDEYDIEAGTKTLQLDSGNTLFDHGGGCYRECDTTQHVFQVYAEETAIVLGIDGYTELCQKVGIEPRLSLG
jgi:hypothetical protein